MSISKYVLMPLLIVFTLVDILVDITLTRTAVDIFGQAFIILLTVASVTIRGTVIISKCIYI